MAPLPQRTMLKAHYRPGGFRNLDLGRFPLVADLELVLRGYGASGRVYYNPIFEHPTRGYLASLAWTTFDERAVRAGLTDRKPRGTLDRPFEDADQGWHVFIFEHEGFVHVLEGGDIRAHGARRWFRTPAERYDWCWANPRLVPPGEGDKR